MQFNGMKHCLISHNFPKTPVCHDFGKMLLILLAETLSAMKSLSIVPFNTDPIFVKDNLNYEKSISTITC